MKRAIKNHAKDFSFIILLLVLAIVVAGYILNHERLRFPFIQSSPFTVNAEFSTGQAVTPGQGQTVRVSGVQIGEITGVTLQNGMADVKLSIDEKYRRVIHTDATALLRPRTGLKDMFIELNPGSSSAPIIKPGFTIPVSNTMPDVNSDEVLAALDANTREYLDLLINGAGQGLKNGGGTQLAQVFERFEPTHRDLARLNGAVSVRGTDLQQLVNSLRRLNTALAKKQVQIVELVDASSRVFRAFASQQGNISRAVADLPGTLEQTQATLAKVRTFADTLGPAAVNLLPAVKEIPNANRALITLAGPNSANCGAASTCEIVRDQIRPFVRAARPLVRDLRPASVNLANATPNLSSTFSVLNHLFNMLNLDQPSGNHPYLWWLAWLDHNARTLFSQQDAVGVFRPLFVQLSCQTLGLLTNQNTAYSLVGTILNSAPGQAACKAAGLSSGPGLTLPNLNLPGLSIPPLPLPGLSKDAKRQSLAVWRAAQASTRTSAKTTTKKSR